MVLWDMVLWDMALWDMALWDMVLWDVDIGIFDFSESVLLDSIFSDDGVFFLSLLGPTYARTVYVFLDKILESF